MRTLALLAALLLLVIQAQARTKHRMGQQGQDQYQAEAKGQGQADAEDQDVVITLKGAGHHSKVASGSHRRKTCTCRQEHFCRGRESPAGSCKVYGAKSTLCCP